MIRAGRPADAEAIENVRIAAWRAAYKAFMPTDYLEKLESLKNIEGLKNRLSSQDINFSLFVAEENENLVAFSIVGKPRYKTDSSVIELWALNVTPDHWRKRIGLGLTKNAFDFTKEAGFDAIELWCILGNSPAEMAYENAGFERTGKKRSSSSLTGKPIDERHYRRKL